MIDWRIGVLVDTQRGGGGGRRWGQVKNQVFTQFSGDTHHYLVILYTDFVFVCVISLCDIGVDYRRSQT